MRKACWWVYILIAVVVGLIIAGLGLFGALTDLNMVYFVILGIAVLSLALVNYYALRRNIPRIDLKCLIITAFIALVASILGIIIDVLTLFELPLLFAAVAAITIVLIADFLFIRFITRRGGGSF